MKAVLLISHGSRSLKTKEEVVALINQLKLIQANYVWKDAYLELTDPNISTGIDQCIKEGATEIVVLLNFLNAGRHVNEDIPEIINRARKQYPHILIKITEPVGQHPRIKELFLSMIE